MGQPYEVQIHSGDQRAPTPGALVLPCSSDQFSAFVASLLGRPQELTGRRSGQYKVDKAEVMQLYHLITQRVAQQHNAKPLQFTARIQFDNGTSTLLNTVADFEAYHEVRSVQSIGLILSWTYVLQFPGAASPEKQEIEFAFVSEVPRLRISEAQSDVPDGQRGVVQYRIRHTARTWGADIEALLAHYIDNLIKPESSFRKFLRTQSGPIGLCFMVLMLAILIGGAGYVNSSVMDQQGALLAPALGPAVSPAEKLDGIIAFLSAGRDAVRSLYNTTFLILAVIGSVSAGAWVGVQAEKHPPADVILTKRSEEAHAKRQTAYDRSLRKLVISVGGALILAIAANAIYDYLVKSAIESATLRRVSASETKYDLKGSHRSGGTRSPIRERT